MEVGRLFSLEKLRERLPADGANGNGRPQPGSASDDPVYAGRTPAPAPPADAFTTSINFDYLPSGRIYLNQDARNQLIDFFE